MKKYHLTVLSPEGEIYNDDVIGLSLRGAQGDLAIFSGHIPFVTTIRPGKLTININEDEDKTGFLENGILNVTKDLVTLIVDRNDIFDK